MKPTIGRIVHYTLSEKDVAQIIQNRDGSIHFGNEPRVGDVLPLKIVRVNPDGESPTGTSINGQVALDGNVVLWVTWAHEGGPSSPGYGTWNWPPRSE